MSTWLPVFVAVLLPVLFLPVAVDGFILPRAALALVGGAAVFGAGLLYGRRRLGRLAPPAAAVAVAALLAAAFSVAPNLSAVGAYGRYESLPMRLAYLGLLVGAAWLGERRRLVDGFLLGCGLASLEAVSQALLGALPRPDGNLGQPNLLAGLLAMALPLALSRAIGERDEEMDGGERAADWRWLVLAALLGAGLAASTSRSGWLAALAGSTVLAVRLAPPRLRLPAVIAGGLLVGVAALLVVSTPLRQLNQDTGSARLGVWQDTLRVVAARPLFGWGEDTLGLIYGRYQSRDWEPGDSFDRAHSLPLDLAAAQGVVGLAACAWLFGVWWLAVVRHRRLAGFAGAAAAYLAWALFNFDWAPATAALWLLAGAAWPAVKERRRHKPHLRGRIHSGRMSGYLPSTLKRHIAEGGWGGNLFPPRLAWRAVLAGAAVGVALALAATAVLADLHFYRGRADQAAVTDPLQPRYRAAGGSLDDLRAAAHLHDPQPSTYVALGDAEARAGHPDRARAAYETALELYPYYEDARKRLALSS